MRYVRAWEKARREQNVLRCESEMDKLKRTRNDYYARERNENRVNGELTRYLTRRIAVSANSYVTHPISLSLPPLLYKYKKKMKF